MNLHQQILTENDCYRAGKTIVPQGVMLHSTGANNPRLSRYVAPNDGLLGEPALRHWNQRGVAVCPHAFLGRLMDGSVASYQTLPWNRRGWHCGKGARGSGNDTHISIEICEDGLTDADYFKAAYREAVELTAYLCKMYKLNPLADGVVICHAEGYKRGIASNHADVMHWFKLHGKTMDDFRADVAKEQKGDEAMSYEQFKQYMNRYLKERANQPASGWATVLLEEAKNMGLTDGTRPRDFATREECAIMARAAAKQNRAAGTGAV